MTGIELYLGGQAVGTYGYEQFQAALAKARYYAVAGAIAVMSEDIGTENHANRVLWAKKVLKGDMDMHIVVLAVLKQLSGPVEEATNSDFENATYSIINPMSKAEE